MEAPSNQEARVSLPQFLYCGQRTDLVEIAGFARLSERTFALALSTAGISCVDWTARKEIESGKAIVHIRFEPAGTVTDSERDLQLRLASALRRIDTDWRDMEDIVGLHPLRLSSLPAGTFARLEQASGGGAGHFPRINASDDRIRALLEFAISA
jgi:hypothetical protein